MVALLCLRWRLQCVRKNALKKPDQYLRDFPLAKVYEQSKRVYKVLLFNFDKLRRELPRQRCFCRTKSTNDMVLCDTCDEWYHLACVGMTREEADAAADWACGYCRGGPDADGNRAWQLAIPQGKRKRPKVALARHDDATPMAHGIASFGDEVIHDGPSSWEECVALARAGARKINLADLKNKKKAMKLVNEGGHHIVDEVSLGGVRARGVDGALVDDLIGAGLLEEAEDVDEVEEDEDDGA